MAGDDPYQTDYYGIGDGYTQVSLLTGALLTQHFLDTTCGGMGFG